MREQRIGPNRLILGDCLDVLPGLNDIHACVTDPPYGLGFMGKKWDTPGAFVERKASTRNNFDHVGGNHNPCNAADAVRTRHIEGRKYGAWCSDWASLCLDALLPGSHLIAFGGTRTYHRMACAIEDAGFEVRDMVSWLYGSGFPKSLDVSKAIDKAAGAERECIGRSPYASNRGGGRENTYKGRDEYRFGSNADVTAPSTPSAKQWSGWGTALKPACEPACFARKPLAEKTVAANVLQFGTGAINVDACRVAGEPTGIRNNNVSLGSARGGIYGTAGGFVSQGNDLGRWPANIAHDGSDEVLAVFPNRNGSGPERILRRGKRTDSAWGMQDAQGELREAGVGSAARFFYCAKASRKERGEGNNHPTVKPIALMRWLCRLVTPPGGTIIDPFMGSCSTGIAAIREGFRFIGIERDPDYFNIACRRIEEEYAQQKQSSVSLHGGDRAQSSLR